MIFDYETLRLIWWVLVGTLLIGFALTDGYDMGVGTLLPVLARNDDERRVMINSIGPHWEGHQVWFVLAGGAIFAAWPPVYAAAFSGFYVALLLVLFTLFFRPVGFEFRAKIDHARWRATWDWGLFAGSFVPALIFGVAFGNLLLGVPFYIDETLRANYTGTFFGLLRPFALLTGVVSVSMLVMHGASYLHLRTEGDFRDRAGAAARIAAIILIVAFALAGLWIATGVDGYRVVSAPAHDTISNPLLKTVVREPGAWLVNYRAYPLFWLAPAIGFLGAFAVIVFSRARRGWASLISSGLAVTGVILTGGFALFPFIMPSNTQPNTSLTLWDSTSSAHVLTLMFFATVVFLPLVLAYTVWAYRVMRGPVTVERVRKETHSLY